MKKLMKGICAVAHKFKNTYEPPTRPGFIKLKKNGYMYYNYENSSKYARENNIKSSRQWRNNKNLPKYYPQEPQHTFKGLGWKGWQEFLGTNYLPYKIVKNFAKWTGIITYREWREAFKKGFFPEGIPATPEKIYRHERNMKKGVKWMSEC